MPSQSRNASIVALEELHIEECVTPRYHDISLVIFFHRVQLPFRPRNPSDNATPMNRTVTKGVILLFRLKQRL
jgi:hypothetical protein